MKKEREQEAKKQSYGKPVMKNNGKIRKIVGTMSGLLIGTDSGGLTGGDGYA